MSKSSMKLNDILLLDTVRKLEVAGEGIASREVFKDLKDAGYAVTSVTVSNRLAFLTRQGKLHGHHARDRNRYGTHPPIVKLGLKSGSYATRWLYRGEGAIA